MIYHRWSILKTPPLLQSHLSPPSEVCGSPDQPLHYYFVGVSAK